MKRVKFRWIVILAMVLGVVGLIMWQEYQSDKYIEEYRETQRTRIEYHMTQDEADQMEKDIANFLAKYGLYSDDPDSVSGYSISVFRGWKDNVDGDNTKSKVLIAVGPGGGLAFPHRGTYTFDQAKDIADGYYSAMTLFLGESRIGEYDISVFIDGYEWLNNEYVEATESE